MNVQQLQSLSTTTILQLSMKMSALIVVHAKMPARTTQSQSSNIYKCNFKYAFRIDLRSGVLLLRLFSYWFSILFIGFEARTLT